MSPTLVLSRRMYYSYGSFFVLDTRLDRPVPDGDDAEYEAGFVSRPFGAQICTPDQHGFARLRVYIGPVDRPEDHDVVVELPIEVTTGQVEVCGPEEVEGKYVMPLACGHYAVTVAQREGSNGRRNIDLHFVPRDNPLGSPRVIRRGDAVR